MFQKKKCVHLRYLKNKTKCETSLRKIIHAGFEDLEEKKGKEREGREREGKEREGKEWEVRGKEGERERGGRDW